MLADPGQGRVPVVLARHVEPEVVGAVGKRLGEVVRLGREVADEDPVAPRAEPAGEGEAEAGGPPGDEDPPAHVAAAAR